MTTLPHGMSADELLDACGPSWSAMTIAERVRRGPPLPLSTVSHSLAAIEDVLSLAIQFPFGARTEGLAALARRWNYGPDAVALAEQLGREEQPAVVLDTFTARRILRFADTLGYGLADGQERTASQLATFLVADIRLADGPAWTYLATWNDFNGPPVPEYRLREILADACLAGRAA